MPHSKPESFEHFYLTKIALAEGCGCAEHVTRMREVDAYADRFMRSGDTASPARPARLARLLPALLRHLRR
jgi:hypothetical protein